MDQPLTINNDEYVTVVAVGSSKFPEEPVAKDYVTVLKIGNGDAQNDNDHKELKQEKEITEEVSVYRLPGEKLGFGLKFEGGTKSAEFVKRLFIQSCALNSPASRVQSSWGLLVEGDEVLEIDSVPVNTMTRIDCVRCLKDSNVVIKLLIKHRFEESSKPEDLPLVVSAEKKRTPPPPPPVPPRKVNRKSKENSIVIPPKGFGDFFETPVPLIRQNCAENNFKSKQSPYNSFRKLRQSPEVNKKLRKLSEDGSCPPDAEVYIDLFSQESAYSLSESDDTGSSISTIVDRLGSYPTTTTSSFSGSLPSTPTPIQKHIDLSDDIDFSSENYLFSKLVTSQSEEDVPKNVETNPPLQPPANFQDAPLSYGNEDVKIENIKIENIKIENIKMEQIKVKDVKIEGDGKIPSPPPRSRNGLKKDEEIAIVELPRLVDFVPKTSSISNSIEIVKHFLENEKCYVVMDDNENHINNNWCDEEFYSLEWSPSSKLATIGEDEEETIQAECVTGNIENPVVIIENADSCAADESSEKCASLTYLYDYKANDLEQTMDIPPIYSRQPPDGHEFPDYQEDNKEEPIVKQISEKPPPIKPREIWKTKCEPPKNNVRDKIAMFSNRPTSLTKMFVSTDNITLSDNPEQYKTMSRSELMLEIKDDSKLKPTQSDFDLSSPKDDEEQPVFRKLSGRSMSLCDVSTNRPDKWTVMVEQRRKCLSRLKGLVIPENIPEIEVNVQPFVDLPEIKSEINVPIFDDIKIAPKSESPKTNHRHTYSFSTSSPKTSQSNSSSSAYKLSQKYKSSPNEIQSPPLEYSKLTVNVNNQNDPPKSLESITSPTRSDYSFEYIYSPDVKLKTNGFLEKSKIVNHLHEDESDNDSALSSSQSSYISKNSPPASPTSTPTGQTILSKSESNYDSLNRRLLKAQSVEAINRKNILASARCRSGRDLKVGSPLIQRKFEEEQKNEIHKKEKVIEENIQEENIIEEKNLERDIKEDHFKEEHFKEDNFKEEHFKEDNFKEDNFKEDNFKEDNFKEDNFKEDNFKENNLKEEHFKETNFTEANFKEANFENANFKEANYKEENYKEANFKKGNFKEGNYKEANFKEANYKERNYNEGNYNEGNYIEGNFKEEHFKEEIVEKQVFQEEKNKQKQKKEETLKKEIFKEAETLKNVKTEKLEMKEILTRSTSQISSKLSHELLIKSEKEIPKRPTSLVDVFPKTRFVKAASVNDLRKNFEKESSTIPSPRHSIGSKSLVAAKSTLVPEKIPEPKPAKRMSIPPISLQVGDKSIKDNTQSSQDITKIKSMVFDEYGISPETDLKVVCLKPDVHGGSIGITLAGGADYETKEITIHKIRTGSPANRDARLEKGDRILFINGKSMKNLSHSESLKVLKENVPEVVITACALKNVPITLTPRRQSSTDQAPVQIQKIEDDKKVEEKNVGKVIEVTIQKDGAGLGFSIQGGQDSPQGNVPLVIKKLFVGGAAEKSEKLQAGDELLNINGVDITFLSRIDAWNVMKKLPEGDIVIRVRR